MPVGVGTPDIFVTSLADPPLTLQEQKDIRKRGWTGFVLTHGGLI